MLLWGFLNREVLGLKDELIALLQKIFKKDIFNIEEKLMAFICGNDTLPKPLSAEEEKELLESCDTNENAKSILIERNLRLVVYIAKKFENSGIELEDLISVGAVGLIKAVQSFNLDKNIKLATYASRCIENEILMHLRKVSKQKYEVSLDEPLNYDKDGNELLLADILISEEGDSVSKGMESNVEKQILLQALQKLNTKEQQIMRLRFGLDGQEESTQKEVADILGISQSYISRIEKKILVRLKKEISKVNAN